DGDRGELELALDPVGAEAQAEHHRAGEDEEHLAEARSEDGAVDVFDPRVGAELERAEDGVGDEEDEEQPVADGEAGQHGDPDDEAGADSHGNVVPGGAEEEFGTGEAGEDVGAEGVTGEEVEEDTGDAGTED